jgi:hypothetical protein
MVDPDLGSVVQAPMRDDRVYPATRWLGAAGAYFFVRVARATRWHRIHVGFLPVTAFTLCMAIGTFNHLDRFAKSHVAFWIWVGLHVVTPGRGT